MKNVGPENRLWYHRTFELPESWAGRQIMLNFGACDWETTVWVNGTGVGKHRGGYDSFVLDISNALKDRGLQELVVSVWIRWTRERNPRQTGFEAGEYMVYISYRPLADCMARTPGSGSF